MRERISSQQLSLKRLVGFAFDRTWVLMLFYSIVPYLWSSDVRGSLYTTLFISLCATTVAVLFVAIVVQRRDRIGTNRYVIGGAATLMCLGGVLTPFADPTTNIGMLFLGIGGIATGIGSAVVFLGWVELFFSIGARRALVEMSFSSCAAFALGFVLVVVPPVLAMAVVAVLPLASGWLLCTSKREEPTRATSSESLALPLSRQTIVLFLKALGGAFLLGVLEGFFDVLSGYRTYVVEDIYGIYLLLGGFVATLVVSLIAVFTHRDSLFSVYRFAMILFCVGCLLTPFMGDNNTYSSALIFGGYNCFMVALCVVCIDVAASFRVGPTRTIGIAFLALNLGEIVGSLGAYSLDVPGLPHFDLASITLIAVFLLFVSHLFLFTETDLIRIGIGEVNTVLPESARAGGEKGLASGGLGRDGFCAGDGTCKNRGPSAGAFLDGDRDEAADPCGLIVERYGLSPRESDVLPLLLQGRTILRIQEALFISAGTVSTHIRHIYQKTGVSNRQELIDLMQELVDGVQEAAV